MKMRSLWLCVRRQLQKVEPANGFADGKFRARKKNLQSRQNWKINLFSFFTDTSEKAFKANLKLAIKVTWLLPATHSRSTQSNAAVLSSTAVSRNNPTGSASPTHIFQSTNIASSDRRTHTSSRIVFHQHFELDGIYSETNVGEFSVAVCLSTRKSRRSARQEEEVVCWERGKVLKKYWKKKKFNQEKEKSYCPRKSWRGINWFRRCQYERKRFKPGKIRVTKEVREKSDYVTIQSHKWDD